MGYKLTCGNNILVVEKGHKVIFSFKILWYYILLQKKVDPDLRSKYKFLINESPNDTMLGYKIIFHFLFIIIHFKLYKREERKNVKNNR